MSQEPKIPSDNEIHESFIRSRDLREARRRKMRAATAESQRLINNDPEIDAKFDEIHVLLRESIINTHQGFVNVREVRQYIVDFAMVKGIELDEFEVGQLGNILWVEMTSGGES